MEYVKWGGSRVATRLGSSNIYNLKIVLPTTLLPATTLADGFSIRSPDVEYSSQSMQYY